MSTKCLHRNIWKKYFFLTCGYCVDLTRSCSKFNLTFFEHCAEKVTNVLLLNFQIKPTTMKLSNYTITCTIPIQENHSIVNFCTTAVKVMTAHYASEVRQSFEMVRADLKGATSWFVHLEKLRLNQFQVHQTCKSCQSSPSLCLLVDSCLVFVYPAKLLFKGFLPINNNSEGPPPPPPPPPHKKKRTDNSKIMTYLL